MVEMDMVVKIVGRVVVIVEMTVATLKDIVAAELLRNKFADFAERGNTWVKH